MALKSYLPDLAMVVVADGIRYAVEPSPFAVVELERHYDDTSWVRLLGIGGRAEPVFRLCHLELQVSNAYEGTLPPFNDWLAGVTEFYLLEPDGDSDEGDLGERAARAVEAQIASQVDEQAEAVVEAAIANA